MKTEAKKSQTKTPVDDAFNLMDDVYGLLYGQEEVQEPSKEVDHFDGDEDFHYSPLNNIFNT
jgi:hypothetical protein